MKGLFAGFQMAFKLMYYHIIIREHPKMTKLCPIQFTSHIVDDKMEYTYLVCNKIQHIICIKIKYAPQYSRHVPHHSRYAPQYSRKAPQYSRHVPHHSRYAPQYSSHVPHHFRHVPHHSR